MKRTLGGKGRPITSTLPPSFESWGFGKRTLATFERVLLALKLDCERRKQILEEELVSLEKKEQDLQELKDNYQRELDWVNGKV